ncbi:hypothetical protein T492DRAFT_863302 [Pavlovales sp. CCMP2436]|nr:hypothetical protein T492DRAFT_863302 [Pavlovales sp. CCMP2436]
MGAKFWASLRLALALCGLAAAHGARPVCALAGITTRLPTCTVRLAPSKVAPQRAAARALARASAVGGAGPPRTSGRRGYTAVLIVPTGIGAAVGGYAGDALPVARALAAVVDVLVTHPNVLNGAMLYWPPPNALYVEGWALDEFAQGRLGLRAVRRNRIGLVLDSGIEPELRLRQLQAADAARATLGLDVGAWTLTDKPVDAELALAPSGASWGTLRCPETLVRASRRLVEEAGCTAIALVCRLPDVPGDSAELEAYRQGAGVDVIGGVEALVSRLVARRLRLPCAHAPALEVLPPAAGVSPRAAAEELGFTFLPCVLANLHAAPALCAPASGVDGELFAADVDAVIAPAGACGGAAVLGLAARPHVLLVAVEENASLMAARPELLGLGGGGGGAQVVYAASYLEAVGIVAAHRAGINLQALTVRGVSAIPQL